MNEIEKMLADALANEFMNEEGEAGNYTWKDYEQYEDGKWIQIYPQFNIGKYKADFCLICDNEGIKLKYVVEVDGQDSHKTKEQRNYDYERERYFQKEGYRVIRFTGSDVYNNPEGCADFVFSIVRDEDEKVNEYITTGQIIGAADMFNRKGFRQVEYFLKMCHFLKEMPEENIHKVFIWVNSCNVFTKEVIIQKVLSALDRGFCNSLEIAFKDIDIVRKRMKIDMEGRSDK